MKDPNNPSILAQKIFNIIIEEFRSRNCRISDSGQSQLRFFLFERTSSLSQDQINNGHKYFESIRISVETFQQQEEDPPNESEITPSSKSSSSIEKPKKTIIVRKSKIRRLLDRLPFPFCIGR